MEVVLDMRSTLRSSIVIGMVLCLAGCGGFDGRDYLPTSPSVADALTLTVESASIPADGFSTTRITAGISPDAAATRRTIVFTTTKGVFAGSGTTTMESTVDVTGTTTVLLRSSTSVESATISASVKTVDGVTRQTLVNFVAVDADSVLTFAVSNSSVTADGFSRTRLTATVTGVTDPARRNVTFKTSAGTLLASQATTDNGTSVVVPVNSVGVAVVELQSPTTIGPAFLSVSVAGFTKTATVTFTAPVPGSILEVASASSSAPADGATRVQITATIAAGIPPSLRNVVFTAGGASFASGTSGDPRRASITADASNRAVVDLVAPTTPQSVRVTATVNGVSADVVVSFEVAEPDEVFVSPASAQITAIANNVITVSLLRDIGVASANQVVTYTARDAGGNSVGTFSSVTLSTVSAGQSVAISTATYNHAGGLVGPVTIRVTSGGVTGTATIQIIP